MCFNSLQVESVPICHLPIHSFGIVSIPYRQNRYKIEAGLYLLPDACFNSLQVESVQLLLLLLLYEAHWFQFLIGRIGTSSINIVHVYMSMFQFLIGRIGTFDAKKNYPSFFGFNSLQVESVQPQSKSLPSSVGGFNSLQVESVHILEGYSLTEIRFQFLIGRIGTH